MKMCFGQQISPSAGAQESTTTKRAEKVACLREGSMRQSNTVQFLFSQKDFRSCAVQFRLIPPT